MSIIEKYDRYFIYAGVIINLIIAYRFYALWAHPNQEHAGYITTMATLIGFEFIMVHSGVFMSVFPKKISLYIFFPFYGLFALVFSTLIDDWHIILITYLFAVFNRMRFAFADVPKSIKNRNILTSVLAAIIYFILIFVVAFNAEKIPELGLTRSYLEMSGYLSSIETGGILIDTPQTAMALGLFYYVALALVEFLFVRYRIGVQTPIPSKGSNNKKTIHSN